MRRFVLLGMGLLAVAGLASAGVGRKPSLTPDVGDYVFKSDDLCYLSGLRVTITADPRQGQVAVVSLP